MKAAFAIVSAVLVIAVAGLVSETMETGNVAMKIKPARAECPWQFGNVILGPNEPIPEGCYPAGSKSGEYSIKPTDLMEGATEGKWVCCNPAFWKAHRMQQEPYPLRYIREKRGGGKYY